MKARDRVLDQYGSRVYKNRKEHIIEVDEALQDQQVAANSRSIPGIMTNRGCCYAGCKGVVLGPLKDALTITHGPIGCGFYSWGTRRNKARTESGDNFIQYCFSTDMQEPDIVFGGEKKLRAAIDEAMELFHPKCILICSTCPISLIGDDIHAVAAEAEKKYGISCVAFSCEGYKGVSQSGGHHIANNGLMRRIIGTGDAPSDKKYKVNLLGEYNIGGDGWETERILKRIGYEVVSVFTGDGSYEALINAHSAELNLVMCHRSINYIAEMMKAKFGIPWLKVNFIGVDATIETLRNMAAYFGDEQIKARTEAVIEDELDAIMEQRQFYRQKLKGKTAALFVGGSRSHHYQNLLRDFGVETVLAGYEFAHRDDYEGRQVIPDIKSDADSKNIPELHMEPDKERFCLKISPEKMEELKTRIPLGYYEGMNVSMKDGSIIVDDLNHFETEEFVKILQPDIFSSGIKDKYVVQKMGIPSKQLHNYDYSGPYAGFEGAINFARDVSMCFTVPAWNYIIPPWRERPLLQGTVVEGGK
jgi:nitrogenase molybdenum-iron protein alpha chain